MAEGTQNIRLSKIAREFNIGISTIVDFLKKKGHQIDSNPNNKVTPEQYALLVKEFQSEKHVKEEAKKLELSTAKKETISLDESKVVSKTSEKEPEKEEVLIKIQSPLIEKEEITPKKEETSKVKIVGKIDIEKIETKKSTKKTTKTVEEDKETLELKEKVAEKEKIKDEIIKNTDIKQNQTEAVEDKLVDVIDETQENIEQESKIKVVGKIDLDSLNTKTKPTKKTKAEKEKERKDKKKAESKEKKVKKEESLIKEEIVAGEEIETGEEIIEEEIVESTIIEQQTEELDESAADENFIKTEYKKLEGPTILGKMVLPVNKPVQKKPVASSDESLKDKKKKRKRIRSDEKPIKIQEEHYKKQAQPKERKKKELIKPELDDEQIQKQIKETLARLSGQGKSKTAKYRRQKRELGKELRQEELEKLEAEKKILKVTEFISANELAALMNVQVNEVIKTCLNLGLFVSINQRLDAETITIVSDEFGYSVDFVTADIQEAIEEKTQDDAQDLIPRSPIVTVMGHVDHGKTSLLDYIRKANVIAGEAGGITQHIGAYEVQLESGKKITFLDTPGHEAFTAMRARGAKVTDIVIIVVAADDSVMPQTIEAINHAQAAGVPIVIAINKIDKPTANVEKIKQELANLNVLVEDWGGKYQSQEISAKKGVNIDVLLEKVLLEAELLDLKANPRRNAYGTVIESALDKGKGYIAKIMVQNGTLKIGDIVVAGCHFGRVKAMYNERNQTVKEAGPSCPVLLLGLDGAPTAGDTFNVMDSEHEAKGIANKRLQLQREQGIRTQKHITLDEIGRRIAIGDFKELNIIVKGDVDGSVEALSDSLLKLSTREVQVNVIHKSVGQVTESDVLLASASNAIIVAFQVRPSLSARKLAEQEQIDIRHYSIIYNAINEIKSAIEGMLSPEIEEKIICNIEIREVFHISKLGNIAGCMVLDGKINRNTKIRLIRDGIVVYTGTLGSLKRFKDDVREVSAGFECGLNINNFNDIKVGDIIEGFEEVEVKRKIY